MRPAFGVSNNSRSNSASPRPDPARRGQRKRGTVDVGESTLGKYVDKFTVSRVKLGLVTRQTAYNQRLSLYRFAASFGRRPLDKMGRSDVERWMETLDGYRPSTRRKELSGVKVFLRWMVEHDHLRRDPTVNMRSPRQPRRVPIVFTPDEILRVYISCPDARGRLILLLMVGLGLRCVEISRLELGDFTARYVTVRGKGGHERVLPLDGQPEVVHALREYLDVRGAWAGPLIENYQRRGLGLSPHTVSDLMRQWIRASGVKQRAHDGKTPHGFRRSCASGMAENGAEIIDIAEYLGHVNLASIRAYVQYNTARLAKAAGGRTYTRPVVVEMHGTG